MNMRRITVFLVLGMAAALFMARSHAPHTPIAPLAILPAAAQTPNIQSIRVEQVPSTGGTDDPWHRFEITLPKTNTPLDMHTAFLVDGKGEEIVFEQPQAWSQPIPFKFRLDSDDDSRVKTILAAQGLPIKKNLVTYKFAAGTDYVMGASGSLGFDKTIRFQHEPGGNGESTGGGPDNRDNAIGQKIVLYSSIISDNSFKGDFETGMTYDQWTQPAYAPKFPAGMVHHLSVYVMFTPHQGPPVKENENICLPL